MPGCIDTVQIQVGDQVIDIPWTSRQLRGFLIGASLHSIAREFAN